LTDRRVLFTTTAREHVGREQQWWLENRDDRELFALELEEAVALVARLPGAGTSYPDAGVQGLRRLYLQKIGCHLYYTHNDNEVIVRALWGARRERGPAL
jgi:plasmid stabilization system protein ParE